jgi:hypothetical protein
MICEHTNILSYLCLVFYLLSVFCTSLSPPLLCTLFTVIVTVICAPTVISNSGHPKLRAIKSRRLTWAEHVARMGDHRYVLCLIYVQNMIVRSVLRVHM